MALCEKEELKIKGKVVPRQQMRDLISLKTGGEADLFAIPEDKEDLEVVLSFCKERKIYPLIIGNGTKLLVKEKGVRGVVIKLGASFKQIENHEEEIKVGAGIDLSNLIDFTVKKGLSGLEFLAGIPGTVGGAIVRNAGAFGENISERILSVKMMDRNNSDLVLSNKEIEFGYRTSIFMKRKDWVLVEAKLRLFPGEKDKIFSKLREIKRKKMLSQPLSFPSAGCIFKNPPSYSAGFLIQQAGCAGMRIGDAEVSSHHANFIINKGKATAEDIIRLIEGVQKKVKEKFGIIMETELEII